MAGFWMVRAGERGRFVSEFESANSIAIGWRDLGDVSHLQSREELREAVEKVFPEYHPSAAANAAAMIWKFKAIMQVGDDVVTYDCKQREYLIGKVASDYRYDESVMSDYNQIRDVNWLGRVSRDVLSPSAKNTLGSVLTLFEPGLEVLEQLQKALSGDAVGNAVAEVDAETISIREDQIARAHEFVKDRILKLAADEMEQLVATLLRAMGYKARVTPTGPDRGRDVIASPDGLGLQQPRIIAEVKHRPRDSMGAQQIRSFLGALRSSDCGLYVSTGGFTKEAMYEAERSSVPVTLVDVDELATLVVDNYEGFNAEGRTLLPLTRVYWPVS